MVNLDNETDESLIRMAQNGERNEAISVLFKRHKDYLKNSLSRKTNEIREEVEDVMSITWERVISKINYYKFDKGAGFRTWLYQIAFNEFIKRWKRSKYKGLVDLEEVERYAVFSLTPDYEAERTKKTTFSDLKKIIFGLPSKYEILLNMHYFDDKSYKEISTTLNIPIGTVRSRMHRARGILEKLLKENGNHNT